MNHWTAAAREALERYFSRLAPSLKASGADPAEVIDDLRRHVEQEAAMAGLGVVTEEDLRRLLARIGAPEAPADPVPAADSKPVMAPPVSPDDTAAGPGRALRLRWWWFAAAVVLPSVTLFAELITGVCAGAFFDPLPTWWHVLLVAAVPGANLLAWDALRRGRADRQVLLGWANGVAVGICSFYAILFVPLMLPGLCAVILFGWGLLPLAPLLALIATLALRPRIRRLGGGSAPASLRGLWRGIALAWLVILTMDLPVLWTRVGLQMAAGDAAPVRQRGLDLLRRFHDEETLLRACYGRTRRAQTMDLVGWIVAGGRGVDAEKAREIHYRVTGIPFNTVPAPNVRTARGRWAELDDWTWDPDQAGRAVGGRTKGLWLHSSRLDAVVEPDAAVGYTEWTLEFRNDSAREREVRAQVLLPPGGVVSRVTLWVNGEEREAAFAGRAQVRQAYERIVRQQRDPVLITTCGPDRVLVQCFPVPSNGGLMKIRLGITAPLELAKPQEGRFRWPHFIERNFTLAEDLRHSLWLESARPLAADGDLLKGEQPKPGLHAVRGRCCDAELPASSTRVRIDRDPLVHEVWVDTARCGQAGWVRQSIRESPLQVPQRVVVVVDGSAGMRGDLAWVRRAMTNLPAGIERSIVWAGDKPEVLLAPSVDPDTAAVAASGIQQKPRLGGHDNVPALVRAWDLAAERPRSVIVWVHGPVPVLLGTTEELRQRFERRPGGPRLLDAQSEVGPNRILEHLDLPGGVDSLPGSGALETGLEDLCRSWVGDGTCWVLTRDRQPPDAQGAGKGFDASLHIARLWARDEVGRLVIARRVAEAVELAARWQVVTPVTGAVVLETAEQFQQAGLQPADPVSVPAIPEPATWTLLATGTVVLVWRSCRKRA